MRTSARESAIGQYPRFASALAERPVVRILHGIGNRLHKCLQLDPIQAFVQPIRKLRRYAHHAVRAISTPELYTDQVHGIRCIILGIGETGTFIQQAVVEGIYLLQCCVINILGDEHQQFIGITAGLMCNTIICQPGREAFPELFCEEYEFKHALFYQCGIVRYCSVHEL